MNEFKGTKGPWNVIEHSWSDTSIECNDETKICMLSIYDDATEETQEELESKVTANFKLISKAPEMLESEIKNVRQLKVYLEILKKKNFSDATFLNVITERIEQSEQLIKEATEV